MPEYSTPITTGALAVISVSTKAVLPSEPLLGGSGKGCHDVHGAPGVQALLTLTHTQMLCRAVAQSLLECSIVICMEDIMPSQPNTQARRGSNPLRMEITATRSGLFCGHGWRKDKNRQLDLVMIVNPCAHTSLSKEAKSAGAVITAAGK